MRPFELTRPRLAFIVMTRAALGAGVALLVSQKLSARTRRTLGATLGAIGVATTIPALRMVTKGLRGEARVPSEEPIGSRRLEPDAVDRFTLRLVRLHT